MAASKSSRRTERFAALQPRNLNVSQSRIKKNWAKLPETSHLRVKQLFRSVACCVQHRDGEAAVDVQLVVDNVANVLARKLPRMPFPPRTEETFFDYEATLNRTRVLEAQLTAEVHSASLLKLEIEKERRLLVEDQKELRQLEKALRDEEARRQRHNKGLHQLAKSGDQSAGKLRTIEDKPELPTNDELSLRDLENDAGLGNMLNQLHSHLESMQNNAGSIDEIPSAIDASKAALDCFSWRFLEKEKYAKLHGLEMT